MSNDIVWNDESRKTLCGRLREVILGEFRLAKRSEAEILRICREAYIDEDAPESERESFVQFAANQIKQTSERIAAEKAGWPAETDCDRLDRVEAALRERGIILWQASVCCDTCTRGEFPARIKAIQRRYPGVSARGYAFFIDQNMPDALAAGTQISVYLGYSWISQDGSTVSREIGEKNALSIGHEVCECLRNEGIEPNWNGELSRKIGVSVNWQRRTKLE